MMIRLIAGLLAIVSTVPAYMVGRLVAHYFQGAQGGSFFGQFFWELTAGGFAAAAAFFVIDWLVKDETGKSSTHLVVMTIMLTVTCLLAALGIWGGYEYRGSYSEATGGLLGLPAGFLVASLVLRSDIHG